MWVIFAGLVAYQLFVFGGVLEYSKTFVFVALFAVSVALLISQTLQRKSLNATHFVLAVIVCPVIAAFDANLATAAMAGLLVWHFTRAKPAQAISMLKAVTLLGVLEAILGLTQYLLAPGWIFGYHNSTSAISGTFINKNHFAGFIGLVVPACLALAWLSRNKRRDLGQTSLYVMGAIVMFVSVVFSLSRLGLFSVIAGVVILLTILRSFDRQPRRGWLFIPIALTVGLALWIGIDAIVMNYAQLLGQDAIVQEGRLVVYADTVRLLRDHPLGLWNSSYEDVFRRYQTFRPDILFDHVHNDYLEMLVKFGIPLGSLLWVAVLLIFIRSLKALRQPNNIENQTILFAGIGSVSVILIHSLGDFNLQIPVNAVIFAMYLGMLAAITTLSKTRLQQ